MERSVTFTASADGTSSPTINIADVPGDWTIRFWLESTHAAKVLIGIQDTTDGFATSHTLAVLNRAGLGERTEAAIRSYEVPSARVGVANASLRLIVQAIDIGATITGKLSIEF